MNNLDFTDDKRREFLLNSLKIIGACPVLLSSASILNSCEMSWDKPYQPLGITIEVDLSNEIFNKKNGYGIQKTFRNVNNGIPVFIINLNFGDMSAGAEFACYSTLCTHDSCFGTKLWTSYHYEINCDCHGSRYQVLDVKLKDPPDDNDPYIITNTHARVIQGPAPKPLQEFPTVFDPVSGILKIYF